MRKTTSRHRRPLTKAQLLPLPTVEVRRLSLKYHLALACLADGRGDVETLSTLSNVIELAQQLDASPDERFSAAQAALDACVARAELSAAITLTADEREAIATVIVHHDAQLARVPIHRYLSALEWVTVHAKQVAGGGLA
jgi:hypothetical protein